MKVVVVSDSHTDKDILVAIEQEWRGKVAGFFHCGDSELSAKDAALAPYNVVKGNMDFDGELKEQQLIKLEDETILLVHGHLVGVNFDLTRLLLMAEEAQATMAFYGHSHQLAVSYEDSTLLLNPGSISQPRGKFAEIGGTYAVVDATTTHIEVNYYNRQHELQPNLKVTFER